MKSLQHSIQCMGLALVLAFFGAGFAAARHDYRPPNDVVELAARLAGETDVLYFETQRAYQQRRIRPDGRLEGLRLLRYRADEFHRLVGDFCEGPGAVRYGYAKLAEAYDRVDGHLRHLPVKGRARHAARNVEALLSQLGECLPRALPVHGSPSPRPLPLRDLANDIERQSEDLLDRALDLARRGVDRHDGESIDRLISRLRDVAHAADRLHDDVLNGKSVSRIADGLDDLNDKFNRAWRARDDCFGPYLAREYEQLDERIKRFEHGFENRYDVAYN